MAFDRLEINLAAKGAFGEIHWKEVPIKAKAGLLNNNISNCVERKDQFRQDTTESYICVVRDDKRKVWGKKKNIERKRSLGHPK